jgi:phage terminase large subunit-like protein
MAANRIGKTEAGAYETALHLTGLYPDWWTGKRFGRPIKAWACTETNKTVRDICQEKLLGPVNAQGQGMIPGDLIVHRTTKPGIAESVDTIYVRHTTGGISAVTLKSYQEGRESFVGAAIDFIHLDEEPDLPLYTEALVRTMTCDGMLILTMTPLLGISEVVLAYLPNGQLPSS